MVPSIYDFHDNEIECADRIRRERRAAIIEGVICLPVLIALLITMIFI